MSEVLSVEVRNGRGTRVSRSLRKAGKLPAILYGHGEDPVSLTIPMEQVDAAVRHGQKLVELTGGVTGQALLYDLQWDTYSAHVLHVDLMRVEAGQRVVVEIPVELRGVAPGEREGGVIEQVLHEIKIDVPVAQIPDKLHVNINELHLNETITVSAIEDMPEGATFVTSADETVVHCMPPVELPEEEAVEAAAEPEVIGERAEASGEGDEE
jgi:large subunit ribosomal protein L25